MKLGNFVARGRWVVMAAWVSLAGVLLLWVPPVSPYAVETGTMPPADMPSQVANEAMRKHFHDSGGLSDAVVVFERQDGPLTEEDKESIERAARQIPKPAPEGDPSDLDGVKVYSPRSIPLPNNPLISAISDRGQAALAVVNFPVDYLTSRSARLVDHIDWVLAHGTFPQGLHASVTGAAGYGHDYRLAVSRSNQRTMYVTLAGVIVILLLVYRAPLAILVPLGSISLAAVISLKFLDLAAYYGQNSGSAERIFAFVLLYGAGTDYALLLVSRYRELGRPSASAVQTAGEALNATVSAIAASGLANVAGMLMLLTASYLKYRTIGPLVAACLAITLLVSLTLVPALLAVLGSAVFWPRKNGSAARGQTQLPGEVKSSGGASLWSRVARLVTVRPGLVLIVGLGALAAPAAFGARTPWVYDTVSAIGDKYDAVQGADRVKRHWPLGHISPLTVLVETPAAMTDEQAKAVSKQVMSAALAVKGVDSARSLSVPLGTEYKLPEAAPPSFLGAAIPQGFIWQEAKKMYLAPDGRAVRVVAVLDQAPLTLQAMDVAQRVRRAAESAARPLQPQAQVMLTGATATMADIRTLTGGDFHRIAALVLCLIFAVVISLYRDLLLCLFVVFCTALSYLATLGVSYGVFVGLLGQEGLDWKVQLFLFVVMVAVGIDYSIFLMARLKQEIRRQAGLEAIRQAVIHTGPVVSSCGIIMAATLGSLMAGDLKLLHQLGFAMAAGVLMDTFVVRPLLLPSFAALKLRWTATRKK